MKRSILVPLVLLVYLIGVSIYAYPGRQPGITWTQYGLTIGITLACIVVLHFLFKRRDKLRDKMKK